MYKILLALHLLFAIFAIGPLVHAATTAGRGVRTGDAAATASSARVLRIYAYASLLVVLAGFGLMSATSPRNPGKHVAEFTDTYIWVSLVLWVAAVAIVLAVVIPTLGRASAGIANQESVVALTGRIAAGGGVAAVLFAAIVFLMVYRPGS